MPDTQTTPQAPEPLKSIAQRMHLPLLLFSATVFAMLFLSWFFLLPRFTKVQIGEKHLTPKEVAAYEGSLRAQLTTMEKERARLVVPITDETYDRLKEEKRTQVMFSEMRSDIAQAALSAGIADNQLHIESMGFDASLGKISLTGDIRNAQLSSMTLLAAFIEQLEESDTVTDLKRPAFTRIEDGVIGIHSPFVISFTIKK